MFNEKEKKKKEDVCSVYETSSNFPSRGYTYKNQCKGSCETATLLERSTAEDNVTSIKVSEEPKDNDALDQAIANKMVVHKVIINGEKKCSFLSSQNKKKEMINFA